VQDREWYARRKDKLHMKRRFYDSTILTSTVESYLPGSAYGIKELRQYFSLNSAGENVVAQRLGCYYCSARLEGLALKDEKIGVKTIERYEERGDRLEYFSVTYGNVPSSELMVRHPVVFMFVGPKTCGFWVWQGHTASRDDVNCRHM
jgi:hypothetical protein